MNVGLYLHVPFCRARCHFCAFTLQIHREDRVQRYLHALSHEMRLHAGQQSLAGRRLDTIYFGGGTPTSLSVEQLAGILQNVRDSFGLADAAEISVEAHPDTVTEDGLRRLAGAGFSRISFGVQSMDDGELLRIGRPTSGNRTQAAVGMARSAGFANINLDLIYGMPGQTLDGWLATLDAVLSLEPAHVSCYALTVEEKTRLHLDVRRGNAAEPDADLQNEMDDAAAKRLAAAGFTRYEISNYARPGYACRHNLLYWHGHDYLGLGPSARSYLGGRRFGNTDSMEDYERILERGCLPIAESELLSAGQRQREQVVFGLRLIEGIDQALLRHELSDRAWQQTLDRLTRRGLLEECAGRVRLTETGRRFADSVAAELI
ncbi:MAG TPA: radical SAM family heme chaperone HemW [Nitrospiraceae bacterium]|nr:radical SAM family heme chaperone HemW [Nitrospiraceae bacterium]